MIWFTGVIWLLFVGVSPVSYAQDTFEYDGGQIVFPDESIGQRQSPIDLDPDLSSREPLDPLVFVRDIDPRTELTLENTGNLVEVLFPGGASQLFVRGGPLGNDEYELNNLHFHWGPGPGVGSEHTISGRRFGIEAHLVHFNTKYGTYENAVDKSDGLVVVAIFGETGRGNNPKLRELVRLVPEVTEPNATTPISVDGALGFLDDVIRDRPSRYFTYHGSLTTPPFTENVIWIVFPRAVAFSNRQIEPFRNTLRNDFTPNRQNFRELQPRNRRPVILTSTGV